MDSAAPFPMRRVTGPARDRLAAVLGEIEAPGAFSARRTAPVDDLHLEVAGVGRLLLPVPAEQVKQLYLLGRPARFGLGDRTLFDRQVRDTQEVPKNRVKIDRRRWNKTLLHVLDGLRDDLGLPPECRLRAELHSMLVYGRGQFFLPHQDSERADEMVGSLVVTLPSAHTGGALVVEHAGQSATYRPAKDALTFVAFYSDCRHQVKPVTSGYRVALTYNLLVSGATAGPVEMPAEMADELMACLNEHFSRPAAADYGSGQADPPSRMVYLLDHEYTERGLSWLRLKGSDAPRAARLRAAAARAGCESALALAEVHETWNAFEAGWDEPWHDRRHRQWGRWEDDRAEQDDTWAGETGSAGPDDYELQELIDSSIQLGCWLDPAAAQAERISISVGDAEVCATTKSADLEPYSSEYEGYMGNYGNTMDRWYRRAAVLLWPRRLDFAVRAEMSARWAMDALSARIQSGDIAGARTDAAALAPFWKAAVRAQEQERLLAGALEVARGLDEGSIAAILLAPFQMETLSPAHAAALAALAGCYGEQWAGDLVRQWSGRPRVWLPEGQDRKAWLTSLPGLGAALHAVSGSGTLAARLLTASSWRWLSEEVRNGLASTAPSRREAALSELGRPIANVLEAVAVTGDADLRDEIVGACCRDDDLVGGLIAALRSAAQLTSATGAAAGLDAIARHCIRRLESRLARPPRTAGDWSIELPRGCSCELCDRLGGFLHDAANRSLEWPLREDGRRHVHSRIDSAELPVRHQTRRTGRPYTLVLTKATEELIDSERRARDRDEADLRWLRAVAKTMDWTTQEPQAIGTDG